MNDETKNHMDLGNAAMSRRGAFALAGKLGIGAAGLAGGLAGISAAKAADSSAGLPKKPYKFHFVCHVTLD
ncbi:hypothetical protein EN759_08045, partial [Mesorhizobium sp. M00.F.Ca.ET.038.03.1.1]